MIPTEFAEMDASLSFPPTPPRASARGYQAARTYVLAGLFLLPAALAWIFGEIFVFPTVERYWFESIASEAPRFRWLFEGSSYVWKHAGLLLTGVGVALVCWELLVRPGPSSRVCLIGLVVIILNTLVLICWCSAAILAIILNARFARLAHVVHPESELDSPWALQADEAGSTFIVTGLAGMPLGQEIEVAGVAFNPPGIPTQPGANARLEITEVNGATLAEKRRLPLQGVVAIPDGVQFRLLVIEEADIRMETFPPPPSDDEAAVMQTIDTYLHIVRQIAPAAPSLVRRE